jgi:hypothetical protein
MSHVAPDFQLSGDPIHFVTACFPRKVSGRHSFCSIAFSVKACIGGTFSLVSNVFFSATGGLLLGCWGLKAIHATLGVYLVAQGR